MDFFVFVPSAPLPFVYSKYLGIGVFAKIDNGQPITKKNYHAKWKLISGRNGRKRDRERKKID